MNKNGCAEIQCLIVCCTGSSRSYDVFSAGAAVYSTAGSQLIASNEGTDLSGRFFGSLRECADMCTARDDCNSFSYNNQMVRKFLPYIIVTVCLNLNQCSCGNIQVKLAVYLALIVLCRPCAL